MGRIEEIVKELMKEIEKEYKEKIFNDEEWKNTPKRIERMWKEFSKYRKENFSKFKTFKNPNYDQLIIVGPINIFSFCSHHLLPFFGKAWVGYLPDKKICGLSKIPRIVKAEFMKPGIQEDITNSLADKLFEKLKPRFLMVVVKAKHLCMVMRGVKENGNMITSAIRWREDYYDKISHLKQEFLSLLEIKEDII